VGRDVYDYQRTWTTDVSIHAPVWGATPTWFRTAQKALVSIHAPVWGATEIDMACIHKQIVSIHAPVWGATRFLHAR